MNLSAKNRKALVYVLHGISLFSLAFVIAYTWRSEDNVPSWTFVLLMLPSFLASYLDKKTQKSSAEKDK
jgi:hypothetical protein